MIRRDTWCGVRGNGHTVSTCAECRRLRMREYRRRHGQPPRPVERIECFACGTVRGNSLDVKVARYPILRWIPKLRRNVCVASLPICDRCINEGGTLSPSWGALLTEAAA